MKGFSIKGLYAFNGKVSFDSYELFEIYAILWGKQYVIISLTCIKEPYPIIKKRFTLF